MKIMSYNVMSGGFDSYSSDFKITTRVDNLKKIITRTGADIVSLVDTFKWDEIYSIDKLKEMFGYSNAYCINLDDQRLRKIGHNNGITVFSGIDNVSFETISLRTRNCVKTTVKINEVEYDIFSLYLDDLSEDVRLEQIGHLVHYFEKNKPTVIVGDLNTINPKDSSKSLQRINDFLKNNPKFETFRKQLKI